VNVVATYPYKNADGSVVAEKLRLDPKDFRWRNFTADGTARAGLPDGIAQRDMPLYRLDAVQRAVKDGARVYLVEGEKDADNVSALGLVATTHPEGAGGLKQSWPQHRLDALKDADVVLVPDHDQVGKNFCSRSAEALAGVARSVKVLYLDGLNAKEDVSDWIARARGDTRAQLEELADNLAPWSWKEPPDPPRNGADLLSEVVIAIKRFVVLSDDSARALALWVAHTHAFDGSEAFTPYLHISAPSRASGKTTALDVLASLVAEPARADSATPAAIYRKVDRGRGQGKPSGPPPTLLLDELDSVFNGSVKSERSEALRGVLNSGFKKEGSFTVCDGDSNEPRDFATYCPKVLCGIGKLPDTVADRSIPIQLARATIEELERIEPARHRNLKSLATLHSDLTTWAREAVPRLQAREEPILDGLSARQADIWGPLLSISDDAGGSWPMLARSAALSLHAETGDSTDGRDIGAALLFDLRDCFAEDHADMIPSGRLAELLRLKEDRPWMEFSNGRPVSVNTLARLLRPYDITPRVLRGIAGEGSRSRGYHVDDCREAFRRYLPQPPAQTVTTRDTVTPRAVSPMKTTRHTLHTKKPFRAVTRIPQMYQPDAVPLNDAGEYPASWT